MLTLLYYMILYKNSFIIFFVFVLVAENKKVSCNKSHLAKNNIKINCLYSMLSSSFDKMFKGVIWCDFKFSFLFGVLQADCA